MLSRLCSQGKDANRAAVALRLHELVPKHRAQEIPSAPATAFVHNGNGPNIIYVDPENDLVAVVRWIENNAVDGFLKRLIAAVAAKS